MSFTRSAAIFIVLLWAFASCKKTDHYAQTVDDQPFLITGHLGLTNVGLGVYEGFQTSYLVGDTCEMIGKFFLDRPGSSIRFGSDTANILFKTQVPADTNQYTHQLDHYDVIKFLITRSMGLGNTIPVTITANGFTLQAPDVSIRQFKGILRRTDTTLYVDSLFHWAPPDLGYYQSSSLNMIGFSGIAGNGTICFNNLTGVYTFSNGQVSTLLKTGAQFSENGSPFTIRNIVASVISFGGDTVTCSVEVSENTPDTATSYIFRLCKLALSSGTITTINRTEVQKGTGTVNETPGPYEGSLSTLKIVATNLRTDANGSIYFLNSYSPSRTDWDNTTTWYSLFYASYGYVGSSYVYTNICRADASGQVRSLFTEYSPFNGTPAYIIPGYHVGSAEDYLVGLDGSTGYAMDQVNNLSRNSLGYFDLQQDALLISTGYTATGYRWFSYDTSLKTGLHRPEYDPRVLASSGTLTNFQMLPDGDLLDLATGSMVAVDIQNKTDYCYAGTEAGVGSPPAIQNQTTGPAKYVRFSFATTHFMGVDKQGAVYYYSLMPTHSPSSYAAGISFYKLYSKK